MRLMTKEFARLARRNKVKDVDLRWSLDDADRGLIEAELGSCLIKQRVAREGSGKSGGFRVIIYHRPGQRAIFLHMFSKSGKANLSSRELEAYRDLARILDDLTEDQIMSLVRHRGWRAMDDVEPDENGPN